MKEMWEKSKISILSICFWKFVLIVLNLLKMQKREELEELKYDFPFPIWILALR